MTWVVALAGIGLLCYGRSGTFVPMLLAVRVLRGA
jgi:hypothetical protein